MSDISHCCINLLRAQFALTAQRTRTNQITCRMQSGFHPPIYSILGLLPDWRTEAIEHHIMCAKLTQNYYPHKATVHLFYCSALYSSPFSGVDVFFLSVRVCSLQVIGWHGGALVSSAGD